MHNCIAVTGSKRSLESRTILDVALNEDRNPPRNFPDPFNHKGVTGGEIVIDHDMMAGLLKGNTGVGSDESCSTGD
jgi:hypothetical protein